MPGILDQLDVIRKVTMAKVFCENSKVKTLQENVFKQESTQ